MWTEGLSKSYGSRTVLDIGRLELRRGEILAVMGPSGAGKTTLLRLLATLERPTSGVVRFGGLSWPDGRPSEGRSPSRPSEGRSPSRPPDGGHGGGELLAWRRRLAFVPQNPVLFTGTVRDNVALGLGFRAPRLGRDEVDRLVGATLERLGLGGLASARVGTLSAGEVERAALARALVTRPEVLLLDEPTANLDPWNVSVIEAALAAAAADPDRRPAVLLVTHNVFQAKRLGHRAALLVAGRIVEFGETRRIFENPSDPRTAAFVKGEMVC